MSRNGNESKQSAHTSRHRHRYSHKMVNTSKFTFASQVRDKAEQLQEVADEIVKRTEAEMGEVSERDCFEYNGELIDASMMLMKVTSMLTEMSDALANSQPGDQSSDGNSPSSSL